MIPLTNHGFPVRSQWGRYNLPRYIYIYTCSFPIVLGCSTGYELAIWNSFKEHPTLIEPAFEFDYSKSLTSTHPSVLWNWDPRSPCSFVCFYQNRKKQLGKLLTLIWGESSFWNIWTGVRVVWPISWPILVVPGNCWRRVFGEVSQIFRHAQEFPECWGNDISEFTVFSSVNHLVSLS